jgi:hypothetical protein
MTEHYGGFVPVPDELTVWARHDPWTNPGVALKMSPDPLGGPNKVIRLVRHNDDGSITQMGKSVLYPVSVGTEVRMGEDGDSWIGGIGWREMLNGGVEAVALKPRVWFVEVDEKRILEIPWHEALPELIPVPKMPWYREVRWSIRNWRAYRHRIVDRAAHRLGYQRIGECDCDE